jgi:hypothetical protein
MKLQEELVTDPQPALVLNEEMQSSLKPSPGSEEKNVKSIQEVRLYILHDWNPRILVVQVDMTSSPVQTSRFVSCIGGHQARGRRPLRSGTCGKTE